MCKKRKNSVEYFTRKMIFLAPNFVKFGQPVSVTKPIYQLMIYRSFF